MYTWWESTQPHKEWDNFASTWMDFEGIVPNEISQRKIHTVWYQIFVESKKYNNIRKKKKHTHRYREQTSGYQWREGKKVGQYQCRELIDSNYHL